MNPNYPMQAKGMATPGIDANVVHLLQRISSQGVSVDQLLSLLPKEQEIHPLSHYIRIYLDEKSRAGLKRHSLSALAYTLNTMAELLNDRIPTQVGKPEVQSVVEMLKRLPQKANCIHFFRNKTAPEIILDNAALPDEQRYPTLSVKTIDDYITRISGFYRWLARKMQVIIANPFAGRQIQTNAQRRKSGWKQLSPTDLRNLFTAERFQNIAEPHVFWAPILAYFAGLRRAEIAQLHLDDVGQHQGIPCLFVSNRHPGQSVKTAGAQRVIPLHQAVIDVGFLRYVADMKAQGHATVFPNLWRNARLATDRFGRNIMKFMRAAGITDQKTTFHGLRKVMNDTLKQHGVGIEARCELLGHALPNINHEVYSQALSTKAKLDFISQLPLPENFRPSVFAYVPGRFDAWIANDMASGYHRPRGKPKTEGYAHRQAVAQARVRALGKPPKGKGQRTLQ